VNRRAIFVAVGAGAATTTAGCLCGGFRDAPCPDETDRVRTTVADRWDRAAVAPEVKPPSDGDPAPHDIQLHNERGTAVWARVTVRQTGPEFGCEEPSCVAHLGLEPGAFTRVTLPYPDGYEVRVRLPDCVGVFQTRAEDYTCNAQGHEIHVRPNSVEEIPYSTSLGCPPDFM
jgi:hypothetical protein